MSGQAQRRLAPVPSPEHVNKPLPDMHRLDPALLDAPGCAALAAPLRKLLREGIDAGVTSLRDPLPVLRDTLELLAELDSKLIGWASGNLDDMRAQLAGLTPPGFLRSVPATALADYPRYLKALSLRAERALRDPVRDQARMLELKPFADALDDARARGADAAPGWQALRWDLEELRVSLFAQELGARGGVSAKKPAARLASLAAK